MHPECEIHTMEQGTPEWFEVRRGVLTASTFEKVLTPTGKISAQAKALVYKTLGETIEPCDEWEGNKATERGQAMEPEARKAYELLTGNRVQQAGFVRRGRIGCSPDGMVNGEGVLEIKCPLPHTHLAYLDAGQVPGKYLPQCHGALLVTGLSWVDFFSYCPELPPLLVRVTPNEFTTKLQNALDSLANEIKSKADKLGITLL